jgi:sterol desaturase/sphingolipid hydroxylase (fatty acid hydroxylase superfamily)
MAAWELAAPRRALMAPKAHRWFGNLGIIAVGTAMVRLLFPLLPAGMAVFAGERAWGLLNNVRMNHWILAAAGVLALDLVIYIQHVMFHTIPVFWRLHMMHHADPDIDVSTGLRFHPIEIVLSTVIKLTAVAALGPPVLSVIIFEIVLNGTSMFNHGNVRMNESLDRVLRLLVVTPDMHRVHHSVAIRETNSNFGFNFPWWDRLLGTYRAQPAAGHEGMTIGLSQFQAEKRQSILWMLVMPFTANAGSYAVNARGREPLSK